MSTVSNSPLLSSRGPERGLGTCLTRKEPGHEHRLHLRWLDVTPSRRNLETISLHVRKNLTDHVAAAVPEGRDRQLLRPFEERGERRAGRARRALLHLQRHAHALPVGRAEEALGAALGHPAWPELHEARVGRPA